MIPRTKNGLPALGCISAMQKCIRRGMEREAMEFAVELMHTSKQFHTMVCNRLEIISHEDVDTQADPRIVPFVKAAMDQAKAWYMTDNPGKSRMAIGNAIRLMARAKKSREGDHFQAAIGLASLLDGFVPEIPDWAFDMHTIEGKKRGRGVEFFRTESTKLVPPSEKDAYEDEAYRMWELKAKAKAKVRNGLFED
jgi:replication-associated recombination protein RarA